MFHRFAGLKIILLFLMLVGLANAGFTQGVSATPSEEALPATTKQSTATTKQLTATTKQSTATTKQLEADTDIDKAAKENVQAVVAATELNRATISSKSVELEQLEAAINAVEERSVAAKEEFKKLQAEPGIEVDTKLNDETITVRLQEYKAQVDSLTAELKVNEDASAARNSRTQDSETLVLAKQRVAELKKQLSEVAEASSVASQAARQKLESDLAVAELDLAILQAQGRRDEAERQVGLLNLQHDLIELKLERFEKVQKQLEAVQRRRLTSEAEQDYLELVKLQATAEKAKSLLLPSYELNAGIAKDALDVEKQVATTKDNADKLQDKVNQLNANFRNAELRVNKIGLTGSVGALLRKRRTELLDTTGFDSFNEDAKSQIDELQYKLFDLDQQYQDLTSEVILAEIEEDNRPIAADASEALSDEIQQIIETRKRQLTAHKASLDRLLPRLLDVQQFDASRRQTTAKFREYINERILWIRSNDILFSEVALDESDTSVFKAEKWAAAGQQVLKSFGVSGESPAAQYFRLPLIVLGLLVCFVLILSKSRMRKEVDELGVEAARGSCVSFWPTVRALFFTILGAVGWPLIPLIFGIAILYAPLKGSVLFYAVGRSLILASLFAIPVEVLRRIMRPQGIGKMHFEWADDSVIKLKQNLSWAVLPGALIVFSVSLLHNLDLSHRVDMLERILFVGGMLFAAYFLHRTCNAKTGVFSGYLRSNEKSWANQTAGLWVGGILLVPLTLAFLAFWGFYYTALNLAECAYATLVFGLIVETIRGLARRFILVRRRKAFIQTAKRKQQARIEAAQLKREEERKAAIAAAEEDGTQVPDVSAAPAESIEALTEIQPEEIEENTQQAYKLISMLLWLVWAVGIWMIWTDVLPALKALDDYTLWPNQVVESGFESPSVSASGEVADGDSTTDAPSVTPMVGMPASSDVVSEPINRITVRDLLLFIVISIVTWVAATNLPNAFEIVFLDELPFDRSFRYALKSLTSYAIVVVGVVLAFRALSIGWSNVQWLATALTFGLAFGLQEIFANFVAGIILMFERPMRIGDLITVDQFTGVVTKIRTRATTIVNWDRKEYVIPNKDFITGRLVNWTLSDAINRIEFTVGIAYGSDVELAKSTLYNLLKKHPKVVDEPASQVVFNEFGESSLNLVVKCFIGDVDSRASVTDSLHTQINQAFNEAGIEISFPQRDLNLRSIDAATVDAIAAMANRDK